MRTEAVSNVFCYSHVERVVRRAKDIHEMHSNRIASFEFVVRGWLRALRLTAFAQGHSTRRAMLLQPCLQLAARSVVMREALVKAESNGDPNGIRTRVTAVKGRCPRPLDDRVTKPPNIPFDSRKANLPHFQRANARSTINRAVRAVAPRCASKAFRAFCTISSRSSGFARRFAMARRSSVGELT